MLRAPSPSLRDAVHRIANLPEVLAAIAPGYVSVNLDAFFNTPGNVAFGDDSGAVLFAALGDGRYEGHYLFHPSAPRKTLLQACRTALWVAFTVHGASAIVGHVPAENLRARALTRALGFTRSGTSASPSGRSCVDYTLERAQWATSSAASSGASAT